MAGALLGAAWSVLAVGVYLAMFTGRLPTPGEVGFPLGVFLTTLYAPFIGAIALEILAGRASPTLEELIVLALVLGTLAGVAAAKAVQAVVRRKTQRKIRPSPEI